MDPLRSQTGKTREEIVERMIEVFQRRHGGVMGEVTEGEWDAAERLVEQKFSTEEWLRRVP